MTKIWRIAQYEYSRHVFNRRFLIGLLSVPLIMLALVGLVFLLISMDNSTKAFGYVDHSGLLAHPVPPPSVEPPDRPIQILAYPDEKAAEGALHAGLIQAYYVLPMDYQTSGKITVVHVEKIKGPARQQFYNFLTVNLLAGKDPVITNRTVNGTEFIVQSADGSRSFSSENWFVILFPIIAGVGFVTAMFSAGGYLLQAMVDEKENRTMELVITSVSSNQLMAGKVIGDTATGLTQILAWIGFMVAMVLIARNDLEFLNGIQITTQTALLFIFIMFPAFILVAALMATIGATVTEAREGQQVVGFISMPIWIPYMLMFLLINNPNSPLAVGLSFFPLTAPMTMLIRDSITQIPLWQIATSSGILIVSVIVSIWTAGRLFRLGMLRYGKRLAWREVFARAGGTK